MKKFVALMSLVLILSFAWASSYRVTITQSRDGEYYGLVEELNRFGDVVATHGTGEHETKKEAKKAARDKKKELEQKDKVKSDPECDQGNDFDC